MLTPEQLAEIRERERKATPGPWSTGPSFFVWRRFVDTQDRKVSRPICECGAAAGNNGEDADFIARARTDIPALLQHIEEQQREIEKLQYRIIETNQVNCSLELGIGSAEKEIERLTARVRQLERVRNAIPMYRYWFDTCTRTEAPDWEEFAAIASEELDAALDAARGGQDAC
jgi:hypothetical protein